MNLRLIALGAGAVGLTVAVGACDSYEQDPQCVVARAVSDGSTGSFATSYVLKEGQDPSRACAQLKPEPVGLQKYFSETGTGRDAVGVRSSRMGTMTQQLAARLRADVPNQAHSVGELTTAAPGTDNFCDVPALSPARLEAMATERGLPDGGTLPDGGPPAQPAVSLTYEWSNLRVYNTPEIPGTQFVADLKYSENGCTAEYRVKGIWPVVRCQNSTTKKADDVLCDPYADPKAGRLRGSGINPLFPVKCDPDVMICVLTGEVPSDRP
jgi:hypothetical protein